MLRCRASAAHRPRALGSGAYLGVSEHGPAGLHSRSPAEPARRDAPGQPAEPSRSRLPQLCSALPTPAIATGCARRCATPGSGHGSVRGWDDGGGTGTASPPAGCAVRQPARPSGRRPRLSRPAHIPFPSRQLCPVAPPAPSDPSAEGPAARRDSCRRLTGTGRAHGGQAALPGARRSSHSVSPPGYGRCRPAAERGAWPRPRCRPRYETGSMRVSFSKP